MLPRRSYAVLQAYLGVIAADLVGNEARNALWKGLGDELLWLSGEEPVGLVAESPLGQWRRDSASE